MILASLRAHVERTEDVLLPRTPGLHQRGFATARLRFGAVARLGVLSFHLSLQARERREQARALRERVAALGPCSVAAGDVNERPGGRAFRLLGEELRDAWETAPWGAGYTSTPAEPVQRIDAVFAGKGVEVLGAGVPRVSSGVSPGVTAADLVAATDHLPVLAALRVRADG
jgi:endonuclease/exonuclease/phosphatase family metal-dependent hydrolase